MIRNHLAEPEISAILAENLAYLRKTRSKQLSQKALARLLSLPVKRL